MTSEEKITQLLVSTDNASVLLGCQLAISQQQYPPREIAKVLVVNAKKEAINNYRTTYNYHDGGEFKVELGEYEFTIGFTTPSTKESNWYYLCSKIDSEEGLSLENIDTFIHVLSEVIIKIT